MNLSRLFALVLIFATLSVPVMAREERIRTPNAVESRAAYCLAVLRDQKNSGQSLRFLDPIGNPMAERMEQDNLRDNINRLQNFITPRLRLIDNGSMVTAQMQGQKDSRDLRTSFLGKDCTALCKADDACVEACLDKSDLYRRVSQCDDLDFLPY